MCVNVDIIYTNIWACVSLEVCVYVWPFGSIICIYVYVCVCVGICMCQHVYVWAYGSVYVWACVCVGMYV